MRDRSGTSDDDTVHLRADAAAVRRVRRYVGGSALRVVDRIPPGPAARGR